MKAEIHPELFECKVSCSSCGTEFTTFSTRNEIRVEVCSQCHPFFTGKQARIVDTEGRVEKFMKKFEGKEVRVSKRKRKQAVAEEEKAARSEREARLAEEKVAEEKALREEARKIKRAEERAARQAAQAEKEESPDAEAVAVAESASPAPEPAPKRKEVFPHIDREKLGEFIERPENVDLMKKASDEGRSAVDPLGHELSKEFGVSKKEDAPEKWNETRMWIGRIVKKVMKDNGYEVDRARGKNGNVEISGNPVFSTGSCYKRTEKSPEAEAVSAVEDASPDASPAPEPDGEAEKTEDS